MSGLPSSNPFPVATEAMEQDSEPLFVTAPRVPARALNLKDRPDHTQCFDSPHLQHPHHHRLKCGHDIITDSIERCGKNCKFVGEKDLTSVGKAFECPHPTCQSGAAIFLPRKNIVTKRVEKDRPCTLSHVYGVDAEADQARQGEKLNATVDGFVRLDLNQGGRSLRNAKKSGLVRKRSLSPSQMPRLGTTTDEKVKVRAKKATVDMAETLNKEYENDPAREAILKLSGPGVRKKANGRFVTYKEEQDELAVNNLTRKTKNTQIAPEAEQRQRAKAARKLSLEESLSQTINTSPAFREGNDDTEEHEPPLVTCDHCDHQIIGERVHCFDCLNYDLCPKCYKKGQFKHQATHRFKAHANPFANDDSANARFGASFCACGTTDASYLVLCEDCEYPFHPGCFGLGAWSDIDYKKDTERCMYQDWANWKGRKIFRCRPHHDAFKAAEQTAKRKSRAEKQEERKRLEEQLEALKRARKAGGGSTQGAQTSKERSADEMDVDEEEAAVEEALLLERLKCLDIEASEEDDQEDETVDNGSSTRAGGDFKMEDHHVDVEMDADLEAELFGKKE